MRFLAKSGLALALILFSVFTHAELLEFSFVDSNGESRVLKSDARFANPQSDIQFALSAGIDRRLRVGIFKENGLLHDQATSSLLGAGDRITVDGKSYYGARLSLSAPDTGRYIVKAEILSSDGNPIQIDDYPVVIDKVSPSHGAMTVHSVNYGMTAGDTWKLGRGAVRGPYFLLSDITDDQGIDEVKLKIVGEDGAVEYLKPIDYDETTDSARIYFQNNVFPTSNLDELFRLSYVITDISGNVTETPAQKVRFDNYVGAPSRPFGVYDPSSTNTLAPGLKGFEPYQDGMTVKTNPIRVAWRIPKSNWHEYSEGGLSIVNSLGENKKVGEDGSYVYVVNSAPFGNTNGNYWRFKNFGQWGGAGVYYSMNLHPSAPKSPVLKDVEYKYGDIGWSTFRRYWVDNSALPLPITGIKVIAEPRSYPQVAVHRGSCTIPAGASSCVIAENVTLNPGTTGYLHDNATVWNQSRTLRSNPIWAEVHWNDYHYPQITTSFDPKTRKLQAFITQPGRGAYFDRLRLKSSWLEDGNGNKLVAEGGKIADSDTNYTFEWDLTSLPEGSYTVYVAAQEMHGPVSKVKAVSFNSDKTAPSVSLSINEGDSIKSLDEISITVADNYDSNAGISAISLEGGPANDRVELSWREVGDGVFNLEYPVMFPSMEPGDTYDLTVKAADEQGNSSEEAVTFLYNPPLVKLVGNESGSISIPAVNHAFTKSNGHDVIQTEPLQLADGSIVQGSYDVFATLRSDSDMALRVNGVVIEPGATMSILPEHNFAASSGRLSVPVSVVEDGKEGTASLLITTVAPNAPVLVADVNSWMPNISLDAESWSVYPALQEIDIQASINESAPCKLTANAEEASSENDPVTDPVCLLEWTSLPDEGYQTSLESESAGLKVTGYAASIGLQPVGYRVSVFDYNGIPVEIESGYENLEVLFPEGSIKVGVNGLPAQIERLVQPVEVKLEVTSGLTCKLTTDEVRAIDETSVGEPTCFVLWEEIPSGLEQVGYTQAPILEGTVDEKENASDTLSWKVFAYTPSGVKVEMGNYEKTVNLIDPPAPVITMEEDHLLEGNLYISPFEGGYLGDYVIQGRPSSLEVESYMDGVMVDSEYVEYLWGEDNGLRRRLVTTPADLWSVRNFEVKARYERLPRLESTKLMRLLTVPSEDIRPVVTPSKEVTLNTEKLDVEVTVKDPFDTDSVYDPETMGEWDVRLVDMKSLADREPLTEFVRLDAKGLAQFSVDLKGLESRGLRLMAEARLVSPFESYQRTDFSPRPAYITVLRGEAIDSSVDARRLVGQAPLTIMASLDLENRMDYESLGEVTWEHRKDGDSEWQSLSENSSLGGRIVKTYPAGKYQLRARVMNRHSGAEFITEAADIHSFNLPEVRIEGPQNIFIGDTANYSLNVTHDGETLSEDDVVVQWSEDDGETWKESGLEHSISRNERARVSLDAKVRMKNAPSGFEDAWVDVSERISFREVEAPRIGIFGPRLVEVDQEEEWRGLASTPYRQMDVTLKGEFILPDGTTEPGEILKYTPTSEDLDNGYVFLKYRAWIEGFEDQGAETVYERRIRIWEYEWPNWSFYVRQSAHQAPAEIYLRVRNPGGSARYIEGLKFEWTLPSEGKVVEDRYEDGRSLVFDEPGQYEVSVRITDDRGHESVIYHQIELAEQDPWLVDFSYRTSNDYQRAPLTLSFRPDVGGGHPRDRLMEYRYYRNGELISEGQRYGEVTLDEGQHTVALEIVSQFGHTVRSEKSVQVNPNQAPSCELDTRTMSSGWRFYAYCDDPDGRIEKHQWTVDGELVGISGSRISVTSRDGKVPSVELIGFDDSSEPSPPVIW